jgi:hypothetical protein
LRGHRANLGDEQRASLAQARAERAERSSRVCRLGEHVDEANQVDGLERLRLLEFPLLPIDPRRELPTECYGLLITLDGEHVPVIALK